MDQKHLSMSRNVNLLHIIEGDESGRRELLKEIKGPTLVCNPKTFIRLPYIKFLVELWGQMIISLGRILRALCPEKSQCLT